MAQKKSWARRGLLLAAGGVTAAFLLGLDNRLTVRTYQVESGRLTGPVRVVLLSDLHSCDYGPGQGELLAAVEDQRPDLVLLAGDMVDDEPRMDEARAYEAVTALAERWPTYYVTGNHEFLGGEAEAVRARIQACGAMTLAGETLRLRVRGQLLHISGIDDPMVGAAEWRAQLDRVSRPTGEGLHILLTHRPERMEAYAGGFDLVAAGHAHGGQWRLPGLINGLLAPNQGLLPDYAGGLYNLEGMAMAVSRGLARESTRLPRLYNPPELTVLELVPTEKR